MMKISLATRNIRRRLQRFARNRKGIAAVEFAAILPVMLSLYVGGAELGDGFTIQFKTALVARINAVRRSFGIRGDTKVILVPGRMLRRKGHHVAVQVGQLQ